jgi:hypothetical protein
MPLPVAFWVCLAARVLFAVLCRRWPGATLYGALAAFCDVLRAILLNLPDDPAVIAADALLFVLPSAVLVRACGASEAWAGRALMLAPAALFVGSAFGDETRRTTLMLGTIAVQGAGLVLGVLTELRAERPSWSRRAIVCLAGASIVGAFFVDRWPDVAFAGCAAYAFVCLAYLTSEKQ